MPWRFQRHEHPTHPLGSRLAGGTLALRIALAVPFYRSGLTKWDSFGHLSDTAEYLFREEFRLHLFGHLVPYPAPGIVALMSGTAEILLPVLLVLGLGTRWAALALLGMTAIIQITVPDGWANFHLPWAAMALALVTFGGGTLALDRVLAAMPALRLMLNKPADAGKMPGQ